MATTLREFKKALAQLNRFVAKGDLNELEEPGLIKAFECTYELACKTLQDLLRDRDTSILPQRLKKSMLLSSTH